MRKINYKAKSCAVCGKYFIPRSGCAKYCPRCRPKILVAYATKSASNTKYKRYLEQVKDSLLRDACPLVTVDKNLGTKPCETQG